MMEKQFFYKRGSLLALALSGGFLTIPCSLHAQSIFSGPYLGGAVGLFSDINAEFEVSDSSSQNTIRFGADDMLSRFDLRTGFGYVVPGSPVYFGAEVSYTIANALDEEVFSSSGPGGRETWDLEGDKGFAVKAKLGYVATPRTLLYWTMGYQQRNYELTLIGPGVRDSDDEDFSGVGFGFGARFALSDNVHLSAEAFRTDYGSESWTDDGTRLKIDPTETQFDVGLIYRFDL
ncbi:MULTISPECIES: outer membrane protein [Ectothiorhodospira]|uniref:outer membrane protein n=1 Tax=Ectothiorhodospira TaxID=1051 RepID=UPI001EE8FD33|nr:MULTISPECIES: outer membrane beta-barrel protein [Ectothiorhodospira]MCG5495882.1 porin family protein [Ectothiorhodospira variabilis]MCG5498515.1 porin family protein [Ectothiorhodospira variabilis]MCG5505283.1 porin family protein [Ectothiorhodospira variabilis]MCG5508440.1 porin family protein [Ectothiorhodospira variabilis]MCG5525920.1 porin family protein [Ectothiorhodospira haloalkaliphila]